MLMNLFIPFTGAKEKDIQITLSKSIVVKPYQNGKVYLEERKVKRGDSIWRIYRRNYHLPVHRIPFFLKILKEMNPQVKNLNRIFPNQKINVPFKIVETEETEITSLAPLPEVSPITTIKEEKAKIREKVFKTLKELTVALGKTFISSGGYRLLPNLDYSPTIDSLLSPVIELNDNRKIIIDFDNTLPEDKKVMIKSIHSNLIYYEIINLTGEEKLEDSVDKLLRNSGFYAVERKPSPLLIGGETQEKIQGDWFVFKDSSLKEIFIINLVEEGKEIKQARKEYVKGYTINFIELKR